MTEIEKTGPNGEKRWLVFGGDWGGQVFATVPFELVADVSEPDIDAFLKACDEIAWPSNEGEGTYRGVVEDRGVCPDLDDESDEAAAALDAWDALQDRLDEERGCGVAMMFTEPLTVCAEPHTWKVVGDVGGGMGGGLLLENDLWLHNEFLFLGKQRFNRLRAMLGMSPWENFPTVPSS